MHRILFLTTVAAACTVLADTRVMCGSSTSYTDPSGKIWSADTLPGGYTFQSTASIAGTTIQKVYQQQRYGWFSYNLNVPNGAYNVTLKFAELVYTAAGRRIFDVNINGAAALRFFDVYAQAGGRFIAVDKSFPATATNGTISIVFNGITDFPIVNAIEITPTPSSGPRTVPEAISAEGSAPNSTVNRPLPLVANWNAGTPWNGQEGFTPAWQMQQITFGHYMMPWFEVPVPSAPANDPYWIKYYEASIKQAAALKLPIAFIGTQWDSLLYEDPAYFGLPAAQNPNVVALNGTILPKASPFGGVTPWREVGTKWGSSWFMKKLQEWYPNPPRVVFISNNETKRLLWHESEQDKRYVDQYGYGRDDNFKRGLVGDAWTTRFRALEDGWRDALVNTNWKAKASYASFLGFGPSWFGRWDGWKEYSLYIPNRIDPSPLQWDGGTTEYYLNPFTGITDYKAFSPQIEAMNWIFMLEEALQANPNFWFEFMPWDGATKGQPGWSKNMRDYWATVGQTWSPTRWGGTNQFGLWLLRPRVVREYRFHTDKRSDYESYFMPLVEAVDRVHTSSTLTEFWRNGVLVPNRARKHIYQSLIPTEYATKDRWFLLNTNLDAAWPWNLGTEVKVYSIAFSLGNVGQRRWLVYANSPVTNRTNVQITLPEYGTITVNVSIGGSFYVVNESTRTVVPVN